MAEQIHAGRHGIPHYQINSPTASFPLLEALRKSTHLGAQPVYPFHHVHLSFTLHPVTDSLTRQPGINPTSATIYAMGLSRYNAPHHLQSHVMYVPLIFPLTPYMHAYIHSTVSITYCAHITKWTLYTCADCSWTVSALLHGRSPCITTHRDQPSLCYTVLALVT